MAKRPVLPGYAPARSDSCARSPSGVVDAADLVLSLDSPSPISLKRPAPAPPPSPAEPGAGSSSLLPPPAPAPSCDIGCEKCALNDVVITTSTVLSSTAVTFMSGPLTPDTWSGLIGMRSTVCRSHASICASTWLGSCTPFPSAETASSRGFLANLLANPGGDARPSGLHSSPPPRAAPAFPGRTMSSLP